MSRITLNDFINDKEIIILGGAMGTELLRRGYKTKLPLWSAGANTDAPELVKQIHIDYFKAGSDICITNTFRTTKRTYKKIGQEDKALDVLKLSVKLAKEARDETNPSALCGGSFAPLEDCYRPDLVPSKTELEKEHTEIAQSLAKEDVDFLLAETINEKNEAIAMARAASETGLPFIISFVTDAQGNLLDGTTLEEAVSLTDFKGRVAISLNCREINIIDSAFETLKKTYKGTIGLYPNGFGHPCNNLGWKFENNVDNIEKFVSTALKWNAQGAKIIGGCCGATPDYIKALSHSYSQNIVA